MRRENLDFDCYKDDDGITVLELKQQFKKTEPMNLVDSDFAAINESIDDNDMQLKVNRALAIGICLDADVKKLKTKHMKKKKNIVTQAIINFIGFTCIFVTVILFIISVMSVLFP